MRVCIYIILFNYNFKNLVPKNVSCRNFKAIWRNSVSVLPAHFLYNKKHTKCVNWEGH